jgi:hypothetical protein
MHLQVRVSAARRHHLRRHSGITTASSPLQNPGGGKNLSPMADGRNGFAGIAEAPHNLDYLPIQA